MAENLMHLLFCAFCLCFLLGGRVACASSSSSSSPSIHGTIAFATVGRVKYAFDIYTVQVPSNLHSISLSRDVPAVADELLQETLLTDGVSVNSNGHLITPTSSSSSFAPLLKHLDICSDDEEDNNNNNNLCSEATRDDVLAFVSERDGSAQIYFRFLRTHNSQVVGSRRIAQEEQLAAPVKIRPFSRDPGSALYDRPCFAGDRLVYVSTREPLKRPRESWTAVFSTDLKTGFTNRITPHGVTDYSPSVSPSGKWVIVATNHGRGWNGNRHDLGTDLYLSSAVDGSNRHLVVKNGGWPSWADETTVFFHRQAEDGWWSIYKVTIADHLTFQDVERVTPPGLHAFTPAASRTGNWIALATRRPESEYRHVEIFDLGTKTFFKLSEMINPTVHHYNPFVSSDSSQVGYHRCRGNSVDAMNSTAALIPRVEYIRSTEPHLSLIRVDGAFPSFSPDGSMITYIPGVHDLDGGVYVMNLDGTGNRRVFSGQVFATVWNSARKDVVYAAYGPSFASEDSTVHIAAIYNADVADLGPDEQSSNWKTLTANGTGNNAFPAPSPDGNYLVFRSGRSGHKNLYIMDAVHGEEKYLQRLTDGPWTDTMPSWSHDNRWIAFASDRDYPGEGSFAIYFIHPDGTGLHKVLSSRGGRFNHPNFSPDSKSLVFTSDLAGQSADPISVPNQFQPYGEIFIARIDGSNAHRLTHNGYEDGTPSWGRTFIPTADLSSEGSKVFCDFSDDLWLATANNKVASQTCGSP
ncbi:unnamed protein product [Sphagnum jensenii]|uniref:Protein TolB n=1 Tax=Sphagnum jensenii TaxID=128206 RepID=A0ABP0XFK9_9BRYO